MALGTVLYFILTTRINQRIYWDNYVIYINYIVGRHPLTFQVLFNEISGAGTSLIIYRVHSS